MNNLITELEAAINTEHKTRTAYAERVDSSNLSREAMDLHNALWDAIDDTDTLCRKLAQIRADIYWEECHSKHDSTLEVTIQDCREKACDDVDKIIRNIKQRVEETKKVI